MQTAHPDARAHERGSFRGTAAGPTVLVVGGIHGNEPAGIVAGDRVLRHLQSTGPPAAGEAVFLSGNLEALRRRVRFVDRDLNRIWLEPEVREDAADDYEARERRGTLAAIEAAIARRRGPVYLLDLHTSSAPGAPFLTVGDTLRNRRFARRFPLPLILGLEEQIDGALLEFMNNRGLVTVGVEAGQHDDPGSAERLESVVWIALVESGFVAEGAVPDGVARRDALRKAGEGLPRIVEVRHRHALSPDDRFRMLPGFANFDVLRRGQIVAHDRGGEVRFPEDGRMLLPLYQGLGNDGFFVSREVRPVWLGVSAILRRLRVGRLLEPLPGVRRVPGSPGTLEVDTRIASLYPLEIFHLLGYRKVRHDGAWLTVSRRAHDLRAPERYDCGTEPAW